MRTKTNHPNIDNYNGYICDSYFSNLSNENNVYGLINTIYELLSNSYLLSSYNCFDEKKEGKIFGIKDGIILINFNNI